MAKTGITDLQRAMIRTLTRRANRRLERATAGQRSALEWFVRKETGGLDKFSASSAGLTFIQARQKIAALERFLAAKTTTRAGWEEVKAESVKKAGQTLGLMGYHLTDEELAALLKQIDTKNKADYYDALDKVEAAKMGSKNWEGTSEQIAEALKEKISSQQALKQALKAQGKE